MSSALPPTSSSPNLTVYTGIFHTAIGFGGISAFVSAIARQKFSCFLGAGMCGLGFLGVQLLKQIEAKELPQTQTAEAFVATNPTFSPLRQVVAGLARRASLTTEAQVLTDSLGSDANIHANSTTLLGILGQVSDFLAALTNKWPNTSTDHFEEVANEENDNTRVDGSMVVWDTQNDPKS